jgi:putative Mg2+ transporter-C (MgtC) family protein
MSMLWPYLGDLHQVLPTHPDFVGFLVVLCAIGCGAVAGIERERRDKPAGMRTMALICVGSAIFTAASILISGYRADAARIAAQVVVGVGFLGAGAIIRDRGRVVGLTTGATIWTVAAIGVMIGIGYVAAGVALTALVLGLLTFVKRIERQFIDPCHWARCRILYEPARGKTRFRVLSVLDRSSVPDGCWRIVSQGPLEAIELRYCTAHRQHRAFVARLVSIPEVVEFQSDLPVEGTSKA